MIKRRVKSIGLSSRDVKRAWKRKVKEWAVFLKDDVDFDFAGIIRVLIYKLKRTRESLGGSKVRNNKKECVEIKRVERLLQRVYDDDYFDKYNREVSRKFGRLYLVKSVDKGGWVSYTWRNDGKRRRKASSRAFRLADEEKRRDFRLACRLMCENIWKWWD